jgi:sodium/hydrogen exchanger 8
MFVILGLLVVSVLVGVGLKKVHSKYFGESAATIMVGVLVGAILYFVLGENSDKYLTLSSEFFYVALLPPIIFDAGYATRQVKFFKNFHTILGLAFIGTIFSALFGAAMVYLSTMILYDMGILTFYVSGLESLLYGSLLSATDTVSVLATLSEMPIDKNLYVLLFGEAALNDAVAIILYRLFYEFAKTGTSFTGIHVLTTTAMMIGVFIGSVLLGLFCAMSLSLILKYTHLEHEPTAENTMVLIFGYTSYLIAEWTHLSGIVAILFAGIGMSQYAAKNLSNDSRNSSKTMIRVLSFVCETAIFIYLGLAVSAYFQRAAYNWIFIGISMAAVLLSRVHVFAVSAAANYFPWFKPSRYIPFKQQIFLWYANLRGGIAFVLALQVEESEKIWPEGEFREIVLGTTLALVFITVELGGAGTPVMISLLGLLVEEDDSPDFEETEDAPISLPEVSQLSRGKSTYLVNRLKGFNKRVLIPFFTRERPVYSANFALEGFGSLVDDDESSAGKDTEKIDYNGIKFYVFTHQDSVISERIRKALAPDWRGYKKNHWIIDSRADNILILVRALIQENGIPATEAASAKLQRLEQGLADEE